MSHSPLNAIVACCLALAFTTCMQAQPPAGYYESADGLTGQALRSALHDIIKDHTAISYSSIWSAFATTDTKPGNVIWDLYSDTPGGTPPYTYTLYDDQCGNYSGEGDCYNREHSFPSSWFGGGNPMRTDLFHIYATDGWVNMKRGNYPYGRVGSADWTSLNGSKVGLSITPGYGQTVFEPIDAYKGDLARTYFYMMTRYYGQMGSWNTDMMANGDLAPWAIDLLLEWHEQDPVSPKEVDRNNAVHAIQHNRNPFIDRPEWAQAIWGSPTGLAAPAPASAFNLYRAGDHLMLDLQEASPGELSIRDASGRTLFTSTVSAGQTALTFSAPRGMYIAELVLPEGRATHRFVW